MQYKYADISALIKNIRLAPSPLPSQDGTPVEFKRIDEITLTDDTVLYGCRDCLTEEDGYAFLEDRLGAVRSHLGWTHNENRKVRITREKDVRKDLSSALERLRSDVDEVIELATDETSGTWRVRALSAERRLAKFQKSLARLGLTLERETNTEDEVAEAH